MRALLAALLILPAAWPGAAMAESACPRQPVPEPLDSARAPERGVFVLEMLSFSASASLQFPRTAWVVRAYRQTVFEQERRERTVVEVIRMQVEHDCNRHFVTGMWQSEIAPERYAALREGVVGFLEPLSGALENGRVGPEIMALDGTQVAVELAASEWRLRREGHAAVAGGGREMSELFHALAVELVRPEERPTPEWWQPR